MKLLRAYVFGMFPVMLLVGGLLIACTSPKVDPDHGVSNTSYRLAISRSEENVSAIVSRMLTLKAMDLTPTPEHLKPSHSAEWWDAQIGVMFDTRNLLHDTLLGSTK